MTYTKRLSIGTRTSPLALKQTDEVMAALRTRFPEIELVVVAMSTVGDDNKAAPLLSMARGMFVKEIEVALLSGDIDLAVHSAKDMPATLPDGLVLAAFTERADPRDTLVSPSGKKLKELPSGSVIGTSSPRREALLKTLRSDITVKPIRGNVGTRLQKAHTDEYDAVVLAAAGLIRMGEQSSITEYFDPDVFIPDTGQGALAIEARKDDKETLPLLAQIDHRETSITVRAERAFLKAMGGGCKVPVAAYATMEGNSLKMRAVAAMPSGNNVFRQEATFSLYDPESAGKAIARLLLDSGAGEAIEKVDVS